MELNPGYKQTEVGVIPEEWDVKFLREIVKLIPSGIYGYERPREGLLPCRVATTAHIDEDDSWNDKGMSVRYFLPDQIGHYSPLNGDLIVVKSSGSAQKIQSGKIGFVDEERAGQFLFSNFLMLLRPTSVFPSFLFFYLCSHSVKKLLPMLVEASTYPNIRIDEYLRLQIPTPSDNEQRAIAGALGDVDALLGALTQLIAKKRDLKQAAMQQLLTGQTRLPGFSGEWEVKRLGDVAEIVMGQSPNSSNYNVKGEGLPLIQGNADVANRKTIKRVFTTEITKKGKCGDILMSVRAPVGEISRAVFEVCLGRGVCAIRYDNDFMYHYLINQEPRWGRLSKGSTFDSVNSADVKALEVRMPVDSNEQTAIADVLSDMDAELAALDQRLAKTRALKQGMTQELLTGRTRLV